MGLSNGNYMYQHYSILAEMNCSGPKLKVDFFSQKNGWLAQISTSLIEVDCSILSIMKRLI